MICLPLPWSQLVYIRQKPVAVLGNGLSGKGAQKLLGALSVPYEVFDEKENCFPLNKLTRFSMVICSPGFTPYHPWLKAAYRERLLCVNELDFASTFFKGRLIAVTGTNGKTSVTEWLTLLFRLRGDKAISAGNNERPLSEVVLNGVSDHETIVCEVSSYQACMVRHFSPSRLLWTNFQPDHLSYHRALSTYFEAKYRLVQQVLIKQSINAHDALIFAGPSVVSALQRFKRKPTLRLQSYTALGGNFSVDSTLFSKGQVENFSLLSAFWLNEGYEKELLDRSLEVFCPPPHRLRLVGRVNQACFWNDSKATNLDAMAQALESFVRRNYVLWIVGGKSKGEELDAYVRCLNAYDNVRVLFLIGETGLRLKERFDCLKTNKKIYYSATLEKVFEDCLPYLDKPCDLVLSPGFASWDQFKNYAERGSFFEKAVLELKKPSKELEK